MDLILASQSPIRQRILTQSRISFESIVAKIDEEEVTKSLIHAGALLRDVPDTLAEMKARKISQKNPNAFVLGCDQVLVFKGAIIGKPKSKEDLKTSLAKIMGQDHQLLCANVIYKDSKPLWRHIGVVHLSLRSMTGVEISEYVETHWEDVRHCAGGYMFENTPDLFTKARGNWFDIMGLSIGPVLNFLNMQSGENKFTPPKMAAVLGHPIAHSKSPKMHGYWLDKGKIPGDYIAIDIHPDRFAPTVKMLFDLGFSGFNVTLPHKESALALADTPTDRAEKIGAANTLWRNGNDIVADNTDGIGFMNNLISNCNTWYPTSGTALVLGAGGAARAVLVSLLEAGTPEIFLSNRTQDRANALAQEFGDRVQVVNWGARSENLETVATIINTTSLGMTGKPALEFDLKGATQNTVVTDLVYAPLETELLKSAHDLGCKTVGGLGMLLHQGVPGFEKWFGVKPVVDTKLEKIVLG